MNAIPETLSDSLSSPPENQRVETSFGSAAAHHPTRVRQRAINVSHPSCKELLSRSEGLYHDTRTPASFRLDENGAVSAQCFHYDQHRSDLERSRCWLTAQETLAIRSQCRHMMAQAMQSSTYGDCLVAVHVACKAGSCTMTSTVQRRLTQARAILSASTYRGLETLVSSSVQRERRNLVVTVLKTQTALPDTMPAAKRAEVIAKTSMFLSKGARQFAQLLAIGDAAVVVAYNQMADLENTRVRNATAMNAVA